MELQTKILIPKNTTVIDTFKSDLPNFKHDCQIVDHSYQHYLSHVFEDENKEKAQSKQMSRPDYTESESRQKCIILYGLEYCKEEWVQFLSNNQNLFNKAQLTKFKGNKCEQQVLYVKIGYSTLNSKQLSTHKKKQQEIIQCFISSINTNQSKKYLAVSKITVEAQSEEVSKYHIYYLPIYCREDDRLDEVRVQYFVTKFLQILNEYVSLDSKSTTLYKDNVHTQFQNLLYNGKISSFLFYIRIPQTHSNQEEYKKFLCFLGKVSDLSLTDKHLLQQIDSQSLIEFKKQFRKLCIEESRLLKSLSKDKNQLAREIEYLLELLDLKKKYPQKIKFNEIDISMLKNIRTQNVEKKTNWIKDQSFVCRNLDVRLNDLSARRQKYLEQEIEEKIEQNAEIQRIRKEICRYEALIKEEQERRDNSLINTKQTKNKKDSRKQTQMSKGNHQTINSRQPSQQQLEIQMLKLQFGFQKSFQRRKNEYSKAIDQLAHYLADCV